MSVQSLSLNRRRFAVGRLGSKIKSLAAAAECLVANAKFFPSLRLQFFPVHLISFFTFERNTQQLSVIC